MILKKISYMILMVFLLNVFVFTEDQNQDHYWSLYYLDGCQDENIYMKFRVNTFIFTEKDNIKIITKKNGEKIGYWSMYVDELGYKILFVDFFDTIQAKFYFIENSFILEGRGKMIKYCENENNDTRELYNFTKFQLVRR